MIASSDDSTIEASRRASIRRSACSSSSADAAEMSLKIRTHPETLPCSSLIGAALSSMGLSTPSLADEDGVVRQPRRRPLPQGPGGRVLDRLACPLVDDPEHAVEAAGRAASRCVQPVNDSATAFRYVTRPSASVVITASPMLASVTRSTSPRSAARACATRSASPIPMMREHVNRYAASPTEVPGSSRASRPRGSRNRRSHTT